MLKHYNYFLEMCLKMNQNFYNYHGHDNPQLIEKINRYKKLIKEITG